MTTKGKLLRSFVNSKQVKCSSLSPYTLRNPIDNEVIHYFHPCNEEQINESVTSAHKSQLEKWKHYAPIERSRILLKSADILASKKEDFAWNETLDTGRPINETKLDIENAIDCLRYFGGTVTSALNSNTIDLPCNNWAYTRREAIGTTVGIGAWNYPMQSAVWKSAPALACGNSMIFKPSEETPLTALMLAQVYMEAGLPSGLFNVVLGGSDVGNMLVTHPLVSKISFTGSLNTGRKVYTTAASYLKKVTLELGGKSPLIIFDDYANDINTAVTASMLANWYSSGQVCSNGTRVFVHESIFESFVEKLLYRTSKLRIGDPFDSSTNVGPMISKKHMEKVQSYIDLGIKEGSTLLLGNNLTDYNLSPHLSNGYFLPPAIFTFDNHDSNMTILQDEIFGMVMSVIPFANEDDVISKANDSPYGLAAGVFTKDIQRAHRVINQIHAGTTWINNYNVAPVELPWGGVKLSGLGRENSMAAYEEWTQLKSVYVEMNPIIDSPYE